MVRIGLWNSRVWYLVQNMFILLHILPTSEFDFFHSYIAPLIYKKIIFFLFALNQMIIWLVRLMMYLQVQFWQKEDETVPFSTINTCRLSRVTFSYEMFIKGSVIVSVWHFGILWHKSWRVALDLVNEYLMRIFDNRVRPWSAGKIVPLHKCMMTSSHEKHFPRNCPFVRGIHRSPMNSPHKGQWRGALMFL